MNRRAIRGIAIVAALATALAGIAAGTAAAADASGVTVRGSVHQASIIGATPGTAVVLRRNGKELQHGTADVNGGFLFRNQPAGKGYAISSTNGGKDTTSTTFRVLGTANPPRSFYAKQRLPVTNLSSTSGYGYLRTRDGTTLSVQVVLPGPPDKGPYPSVVEYSGYDPSSPSTSQPQYKLVMPALGYAWIGVNIRGTGCSGGAFNFFENLQSLDGYDAIETVAAQPWSNGRVGMVGISYAGISQLFVARTRPPHLTAITPVSVIDDTWRGTLYPGGIYNNGFAKGWANDRMQQNKWPNPDAPKWVQTRISNGDTTCANNMKLRGQNVDLLAQITKHPYTTNFEKDFRYDLPQGAKSLAPAYFVNRINVPVFLAGAWQDEQTGPHWANMINHFSKKIVLRVDGQNGVHTEQLDPNVLRDTLEFLDLYVAKRVPHIPASVRSVVPALWAQITGIPGMQLPPDRFDPSMSYAQARAKYQAEKPVKILWEVGAAPGTPPGALLPAAQTRYRAWPIPSTTATAYYFGPRGSLTRTAPPSHGTDSYRPDPAARPATSYTGSSDGIWKATPDYNWAPEQDGSSLSYITPPLARATTMAGTGSVDLWISSTARDSDVQATLSEVRPDGTERYVQSGWLRLSHRKLDKKRSTELNPYHSDSKSDVAPMPSGRYVLARLALFPFAYQFRAGSRIRLTIDAPGGNRPLWKFDTFATQGTVTNRVEWGRGGASRVVLPVLATGPALPSVPAPCPSIRAEPCREYVAPRGQE
ncbi:MAG TPA: CocE/NonD family hydrolase [Acidimicrobiia bacterium]